MAKTNNRAVKTAGRKARSAVKKLHTVTKAVAVLCLLAGICAGAFYAWYVSKNDRFLLVGDAAYSIDAGTPFTYAEEGVEAVCFGMDVSGKLKVETTLKKDAAGNYIIPTDEAGVYTITYTVDCVKFGENAPNGVIKRIRTFTVCASEEDGKNGEEN